MIRPLTVDHLDMLYALRQEALRSHPTAFGASPEEESKQWMRERMLEKDEEDFVLGAFEENRLVAMVGFVRETKRKKKHKGWIWGMYVDSEYQGQGIARALMDACVKKARRIDGLKTILISVTDVSVPARNLYDHMGFELWAVEPNAMIVDDNPINEVYLRLSL